MAYFYGNLFVRNPDFRAMFPLAMDSQRRRLFDGLARAVWGADQHQELTDYLRGLARDHRKFGVLDKHYQPFCEALLASLEADGGTLTAQTRAAWQAMLEYVADVMADATRAAAAEPAWWLGEVAAHDRRGPDVAVITLRADGDQPLRYQAGQYISIQVPRWPRAWRCYSVANAPRADGTLDLHVRAVPGGRVSNLLVQQAGPGDTLLIGPARGGMVTAAIGSGSVLCVAGGTGLAPIKALVEELARRDTAPPAIQLLAGARHRNDLYDLDDLRRLEKSCPSLTVTPVLPPPGGPDAARAALPAAAAGCLTPDISDIVVSGPDAMVRAVTRTLARLAPGARIHTDSLRSWRPERRRPAGDGGASAATRLPQAVDAEAADAEAVDAEAALPGSADADPASGPAVAAASGCPPLAAAAAGALLSHGPAARCPVVGQAG